MTGRIYEIDGVVPVIDPAAFVHPDAVLIGDVVVGPDCYVGPLASLRGDFGSVTIERGANVQDSCVLHTFPGREVLIEEGGHVGHGAVLHGCRIGPGVLVGMNAIVMDECDIGARAFVAAASFVRAGTVVPPAHLAAGIPAQVVRELSEEEMAWKANGTRLYRDLAVRSLATLRPTTALTVVSDPRPRVAVDRAESTPLHQYRESPESR